MTTTPEEAFSAWLSACQACPWDPLTETAAEPYSYIWQSWVRHLGETSWHQATAEQLLSFLDHARLAGKDSASMITRRRYWRLIDRIYEHGMLLGTCSINPAQDIAEAEVPPQEDPLGATLSMRLWHAFLTHLPTPDDAVRARDAALLLLLIELGPTTEEICALRLDDVQGQMLHLTGARERQDRTLQMSARLQNSLAEYLRQRPTLGPHASSELLFIARHADNITAQIVHRTATKYLAYAAIMSGQAKPIKMGAQIIRNTVITHWLMEGRPVLEVLALAGLKSPAALSHLRMSLPDELRGSISAAAA